MTVCDTEETLDATRGDTALQLKIVAIGAILFAGMLGVSLPIIGRGFRYLNPEGNVFFVSRGFAAGVILATGFVHILPEGMEALQNPCLPKFWSSFPFGGFVAMLMAVTTLLIDNVCTGLYENLHSHGHGDGGRSESEPLITATSGTRRADRQFRREKSLLRLGSNAEEVISLKKMASQNMADRFFSESRAGELRRQAQEDEDRIRNIVILQVLEVAVVSHSFIIGLSLGVSENPQAIKPLLAALCFHQFFEGFALGGSICQASFECTSAAFRGALFAVATPIGILVGIGVATSYSADAPEALLVEGLFDSASAGILIYMALVAIIAPDFRSERLSGNRRLQLVSYLALFSGTLAMSSLAIWA